MKMKNKTTNTTSFLRKMRNSLRVKIILTALVLILTIPNALVLGGSNFKANRLNNKDKTTFFTKNYHNLYNLFITNVIKEQKEDGEIDGITISGGKIYVSKELTGVYGFKLTQAKIDELKKRPEVYRLFHKMAIKIIKNGEGSDADIISGIISLLTRLNPTQVGMTPMSDPVPPQVTYTVKSTADNGTNTLRWALEQPPSINKIIFDPSIDGQTILLNTPLEISKNITIEGNGPKKTIISGQSNCRIFNYIKGEGELKLKNMQLINGKADNAGGGAILSCQTTMFTIDNCIFKGNTAVGNGGAICTNKTELTMTNCVFDNNSTSTSNGGALYIDNQSESNIINCTFFNNQAAEGGAIYADATTSIINCTFANNTTTNTNAGGAIKKTNNGGFSIHNTIIYNNKAASTPNDIDIQVPVPPSVNTNNIVGKSSGVATTWFSNEDPLLADFDDYGGNTFTIALNVGSPAIDAADDTKAPPNDQRNKPKRGTSRDIGAYEACVFPDKPSLEATSICSKGENSTIIITGDKKDANKWVLYSSSCGTNKTDETETNSIEVSPESATSYYIRGEGGACSTPGECNEITITVNTVLSNAGDDENICTNTYTMSANNPSLGTGEWTIVSGSGVIENTTSHNTSISNFIEGKSFVLEWTVANGDCSSSSNVIIHKDKFIEANAGTNNDAVCETFYVLAGNNPTPGTGKWSTETSGITFDNNQLNTTTARNISNSGIVVFNWLITNGACTSESKISITKGDLLSITNEPVDQTVNIGNDVEFKVEFSGSKKSMQWYKDNNPLSDNSNISGSTNDALIMKSIGLTDAGEYKCTITGLCNNVTSINAKLVVNEKVDSPEVDDQTITKGETTIITATGTDIKWYDDITLLNLVGTGNSYDHGNTEPDIYYLYVTQTISKIESEAVTVKITVKPQKPISSDVKTCVKTEKTTISAEGTNINWYDNSDLTNSLSQDNDYTPSYTNGGTYIYYVSQTVNDIESYATIVKLVIDKSNGPKIPTIKQKGLNILVCTDRDLFKYNWYKNNVLIDDENKQYLVISNIKSSNYRVEVAKEDGCKNSSASFSYTNTNFPSNLKLFPNPVVNSINLSLDNKETGNLVINIYNKSAVLIKKFSFTKNEKLFSKTIFLDNLKNGLYFFELIIDNKKIVNKTFMIVK